LPEVRLFLLEREQKAESNPTFFPGTGQRMNQISLRRAGPLAAIGSKDPIDEHALSAEEFELRKGVENLALSSLSGCAGQKVRHASRSLTRLPDQPLRPFRVGHDRLNDGVGVFVPQLLEGLARSRLLELKVPGHVPEDPLEGASLFGRRAEGVEEFLVIGPVADPPGDKKRSATAGDPGSDLFAIGL
jgi:hypothetical protein